jgi:putative transposase
MLQGKKHPPEQIVAILRRLETGETAEAVCRSVNLSEATFYRWRQRYGALVRMPRIGGQTPSGRA